MFPPILMTFFGSICTKANKDVARNVARVRLSGFLASASHCLSVFIVPVYALNFLGEEHADNHH